MNKIAIARINILYAVSPAESVKCAKAAHVLYLYWQQLNVAQIWHWNKAKGWIT